MCARSLSLSLSYFHFSVFLLFYIVNRVFPSTTTSSTISLVIYWTGKCRIKYLEFGLFFFNFFAAFCAIWFYDFKSMFSSVFWCICVSLCVFQFYVYMTYTRVLVRSLTNSYTLSLILLYGFFSSLRSLYAFHR